MVFAVWSFFSDAGRSVSRTDPSCTELQLKQRFWNCGHRTATTLGQVLCGGNARRKYQLARNLPSSVAIRCGGHSSERKNGILSWVRAMRCWESEKIWKILNTRKVSALIA